MRKSKEAVRREARRQLRLLAGSAEGLVTDTVRDYATGGEHQLRMVLRRALDLCMDIVALDRGEADW